MDLFDSPFGQFKLLPLHYHPKSPQQAWSAADTLLLKEIAQAEPAPERILLVNDLHGALGTCLHHRRPFSWNDSFSSKLALQQNLRRNQLSFAPDHFLESTEQPQGQFDAVLIRLPKTLSLLEYQLTRLRPLLTPQTRLIGAGMVKHLSKSMVQCFERIIGPASTSLASQKARLVFAQLDPALQPPTPQPVRYGIPGTELQLLNYANVFSQQQLDMGTRFLLEHFPDVSAAQHVLDLGCGNGALACFAGHKNPAAMLSLLDDSWLALQSARESIELNGLKNPCEYLAADGLDGFEDRVDLILCNPPFHDGSRLDSNIALRMFKGSKRCLKEDGKLVVVGNRHLNYHQTLKPHFKDVELTASNPKFVILTASRPR
ncbi:methyltransferase [Ketobacter sp.]|uniref:methyltransferase n=1 Tax=Ketobacter sp. TaxID=2083498 RepID=UPI000F1E0CD3|nr:methyltransferase [Ketobacter sp.]RLU00634.1 MAG: methyltransferase domain-containing protein [Ketobacter sp.]